MYKSIKALAKKTIQKKVLHKNELFFRYFFGFFYKGKSCQCTICNHDLKSFIRLKNDDLLCPFCGSLSRTRRLFNLLFENQNITGKVLHFSPSRSIYRKLKKHKAIDYYSTDFTNAFLADYKFDITKIDQPDDTFNFVICFHILEHIIEDNKAMQELYRVLKTNGICYIQTPFKEGDIYEDYTIKSPQEREKHFGQHDHVRVYSVKGLKDRLENVGFTTKILDFQEDIYHGFKAETIIACKKK
ncbi:methyltransferase domain-containing protein [Winogradskyella sp.]|uniref:methyltransferase domain-containing protein n=1 Tax=Winogradskyella sp. TaxID=1883156 RepID=UPI0035C7C057